MPGCVKTDGLNKPVLSPLEAGVTGFSWRNNCKDGPARGVRSRLQSQSSSHGGDIWQDAEPMLESIGPLPEKHAQSV